MKILILSCSTGGGHNSAARAMQHVLTERGAYAEIVDPIVFSSEKAKNFVSALYNKIIKNTPQVFGVIYKAGAIYEKTPFPSPVYFANSTYAEALNDYIVQNAFDCVLCCHLYGMEAMTAIRDKWNPGIPCYGVLTDYTCIPFTSDTKLDGYFIPHAELEEEAERKGLPAGKIYSFGIPVHPAFMQEISKREAREKLGLPQDKKILLLMFGSVGCGKIEKLCKCLMKTIGKDCLVYLITGSNEKLKAAVDKRFAADGRMHTLAYTADVPLYMKAADVFISKAGGLSSTEAAVAGVPLVHLHSIPGCETKNVEFFTAPGMSYGTKKAKKAALLAQKLLCDEEAADNMRRAQRANVYPDAAERIADKIMRG